MKGEIVTNPSVARSHRNPACVPQNESFAVGGEFFFVWGLNPRPFQSSRSTILIRGLHVTELS